MHPFSKQYKTYPEIIQLPKNSYFKEEVLTGSKPNPNTTIITTQQVSSTSSLSILLSQDFQAFR
jgi:hypothetical protein